MNPADIAFVEEVCLKKFEVASKTYLSELQCFRNTSEFKAYAEEAVSRTVLELRAWALTDHEDHYTTVTFPATWWEYFKKEKFPDWLLERFPIKTKEVNYKTIHVCPHTNISWDKNSQSHINFIQHKPWGAYEV